MMAPLLLAPHLALAQWSDGQAEGQQGVDVGHELANEAAAHQELVTDSLGVGRVVAQCRNEAL